MAHQLQGTFNSIELWYDSDIMTAEINSSTNTTIKVSMRLKDGLYFKNPMKFVFKRDTRADFNFKSPESEVYLIGGVYSRTIDSVVYKYGVNQMNMGIDSNTKKIEFIVNPDDIIDLRTPEPEPVPEQSSEPIPKPEPELVSLKIPRYSDDSDYKYLIENGAITVKINGEIANDSENIVVPKYSEFNIEIINNQLNKQFDYDRIEFKLDKRQPNGDYVSIDISPDIKTPDKIVFNVNASNWEDYIGEGDKSIYTPNALIYLYFTGKEVKPVEDYPFLNIYKVDDKSLNILAKEVNEKRYNQETSTNGTVSPNYDIMGNILDLVRIPYSIQSEPELEYIKLNNESMESQGNQILNYIQEVNLGKIHCYHDTLVNIGYKNIGFNLFVPNFKPIELDVAKVIGRTIEMKLHIDLTTGQGTLNLLIDGIAFHVEQEKISKDIPFKSDSINVSLNDNVLNTKYINPYLEIIVHNPDNTINTQELKQRKINKSSLLYAKSDNIILNSKATYNEQLEIEMLLRKGVYING